MTNTTQTAAESTRYDIYRETPAAQIRVASRATIEEVRDYLATHPDARSLSVWRRDGAGRLVEIDVATGAEVR